VRFRSLGSGSSGNATLIEARAEGFVSRVLVDCGFGIRQLENRLERAGIGCDGIDALFVTHEHADHIGCAVQLARRQGIPLWLSRGTYQALGTPELAGLCRFASDGVDISVGALTLTPFTVPHDAREPLQLSCTDGRRKLGILTDLGHASAHVLDHLQRCHALLLECNHDRDLLGRSSYPPFLKSRVGGRLGHLCNEDAAQIASAVAHADLGSVVAAHLSEQNNRPELAAAALSQALGRSPTDIVVAGAANGTPWLTV
jgi:phosphoribosyl 1,2-cyclic phosphodiesterase